MYALRTDGVDGDDLPLIVGVSEKYEMGRDPGFQVAQLRKVSRLDPCGADPFPAPSGPFGRGQEGVDGFEGEVLEVVDGGREWKPVHCGLQHR